MEYGFISCFFEYKESSLTIGSKAIAFLVNVVEKAFLRTRNVFSTQEGFDNFPNQFGEDVIIMQNMGYFKTSTHSKNTKSDINRKQKPPKHTFLKKEVAWIYRLGESLLNKQLLNFSHIKLCKMSLEKHIFRIANPVEPIIATAIHAGHEMSCFLMDYSALTDEERRYEEDPYTDEWAGCFPNHIIVNRSRFEVDLNRPRNRAIYLTPKDAWELQVWKHLPPSETINQLYEVYDKFYNDLNCAIQILTDNNPVVIVLDLHSYNHQRGGIIAPKEQNPQVNIGTGTTGNPKKWRSIIDCTIDELRNNKIDETPLDVRENIKFKGGHMAAWLHNQYSESVCVLSIEVKKIFMDELSGVPNHEMTTAFSDYFQKIRTVLLKEIHERW